MRARPRACAPSCRQPFDRRRPARSSARRVPQSSPLAEVRARPRRASARPPAASPAAYPPQGDKARSANESCHPRSSSAASTTGSPPSPRSRRVALTSSSCEALRQIRATEELIRLAVFGGRVAAPHLVKIRGELCLLVPARRNIRMWGDDFSPRTQPAAGAPSVRVAERRRTARASSANRVRRSSWRILSSSAASLRRTTEFIKR